MLSKRLMMVIGVILVASMVLSACTPATPTATEVSKTDVPVVTDAPTAEPATAENVFVFGDSQSWPDLDPRSSFSNDLRVLANVYEPLLYYNAPGSADKYTPALATSWEHSADALEWTFHLRTGVKFQDGAVFNAQAVKASLEATKNLGQGGSYILAPIKDIVVVDDNTVKLVLNNPAAMDLILSASYAAWMMSPNIIDKPNEWFNQGNGAGTGPYMIESYQPGERVVLKKFNDYWGGWKPNNFDTVIMQVVSDPVTMVQLLEAGEVDGIWTFSRDSLPALEANPDISVFKAVSFTNWMWEMNTVRPPTSDKLVRQALSWSYPYEGCVEGINKGFMTYGYGSVPPGMMGYSESIPRYTFDPEKAVELFAQAGWTNTGSDGLMKKDGEPMVLNFTSLNYPDKQQCAVLWSSELKKIGVQLDVNVLTWEAAWSLAKSDPMNEATQDIIGEYWWPTIISAYDYLFPIYHCEDKPFFNLSYYCNKTFDKLIDDAFAMEATDPETAQANYVEAQKILVDDAVSIFGGNETYVHATRSNVEGLVINPAYAYVFFFYQLTRK